MASATARKSPWSSRRSASVFNSSSQRSTAAAGTRCSRIAAYRLSLVGKCRKRTVSVVPTAAAICRVVVPANPRCAKSSPAAPRICCRRSSLGTYLRGPGDERRPGEERGVVEEVERESGRRAVDGSDDALCLRRAAVGGEERGVQAPGRRLDLIEHAFVLGEAANEVEDQRNVARGRGTDVESHSELWNGSGLRAQGSGLRA